MNYILFEPIMARQMFNQIGLGIKSFATERTAMAIVIVRVDMFYKTTALPKLPKNLKFIVKTFFE